MNLNRLKPRKSLNKAFLKIKPSRTEIEAFKTHLTQLIDQTNGTESEEFHKNLVSDFLKKTYYDPHHSINTKGRNDLVIHNGKDAKSTVGVILEAKKPTNKTEMITTDNLNKKAFQELILYYLRERITHKNLEVRNLVITNTVEWFIFDEHTFEKLFAQNKKLVKQFEEFEAGKKNTSVFYNEIAAPFIEQLETTIEFTYFDLKEYDKPLRNNDTKDDNKLIALFKLLSPEHLLKLPFTNDSNSLDKTFYSELLHIIGLTETKVKGKKIIERQPAGKRNTGSLLENAIIQLDTLDKIHRLEKPSQYGATLDERFFNVGLELAITWVNRILFLKLLEAQLISYNRGDASYAFLNFERINNYDDLNSLFFQVLAKKYDRRNEDVKEEFAKVPYLNSSLFEPNELEHSTILISNLRDEKPLPILSSTVLKDENGKKRTGELNALEYFFAFLEAYDFSSEGAEDIQEDNKTLINASVLGLIFEKINGYKDGSFFTPGFITMYMCRETIRRSVVQKFNDAKGWKCKDFPELREDLNDYIRENDRKTARKEANDIINSLKICDPAVGSGHFLVSALNEVIAIKNDLHLLVDKNYERLSAYSFEVVNDELVVTDDEGELFEYVVTNKETLRVQETLFHEKQTIIENCLFGVDINPNSVKICRLRLWIELLKNSYYISEDRHAKLDSASHATLQTLPNIDINIKCGNSLISRFDLDANIKEALKKSKWTIDSYRLAVDSYRNAKSKEEKHEMERLINDIKSDFRSEISKNDPKLTRLYKLNGELLVLTTQTGLFEMGKKEKTAWNKKVEKLTKDTKKLETEIEDIKNNKIYENAFEWRFEFPEVLNDEGDFVGFDTVIGNPPYIRQEELKEFKPHFESKFKTFTGTADLFVYFVELGINNLTKNGEFTFIIPNKWMRANYGKALRNFVKEYRIQSIIDFGDLPVFEEATTYPCILSLAKSEIVETFSAVNINTLQFPTGLQNYLNENRLEIILDELSETGWSLSDSNVQKVIKKLKNKGVSLGEYVNGKIFYGIKTGFNEAFVINEETKNELIIADNKSEEVIKPFLGGRDLKRYKEPKSDKYLIFTRRGIEIEKYPAILNYLNQFKERLEPKPKDFSGAKWKGRKSGTYKWYEIQDAVDYHEEFETPKIMLPDISLRCEALYDSNNYYCVNTAYVIPKMTYSDLGILNSKLILFFYSNLTQTIRGGYFRFIRQYLEKIPIVNTDILTPKVTEILALKKENPEADTSTLEAEIDQLVYELYELTPEEIEIVENSVK